jgi:DNA polymerase III delta prime subunit
MKNIDEKQFLWVEKYRPQNIEDCIIPESTKKTFKEFVARGEISNMLLAGGPGTGKTTVAKAMCHELGADWMIINGSDENGIDILRTKIKNFASTVSLLTDGKPKVVIFDESDYLTPQVQGALRNFIEEFSNNCRFIFTCNYKNRIIEPLRNSRLANVDFVVSNADKPKMMAQLLKRLQFILDNEGVEYENSVLAEIIKLKFPDNRRVINELQQYSLGGKIDIGALATFGDERFTELSTLMKKKQWGDMRKWVSRNSDIDSSTFFRKVYDSLYDLLTPESIPSVVVILADYQYKAAFVADQEINLVACLTEIMGNSVFK